MWAAMDSKDHLKLFLDQSQPSKFTLGMHSMEMHVHMFTCGRRGIAAVTGAQAENHWAVHQSTMNKEAVVFTKWNIIQQQEQQTTAHIY